jgi:hypothetical protein
MMAPLLAKRSDLVLVNHLLLIRPIRHLIRGAIFRCHCGGTACSAAPYVRPLYQPGQLFLEDAIFSESFDNPDFAPMLFDRLAVEVFEPLGKIATIEDLIESSWGKRVWETELFHSILLSRGLEEATALAARSAAGYQRSLAECKAQLATANRKNAMEMYFRRSELKSAEKSVESSKERQAFLARGEAAIFAHYRDWEAQVARGHKIEHAYEPSPFPAQLPADQRAAKAADPKFAPTPWRDFPPTWRQDPPEAPGEIRFAGHWWYRQGRLELLHPMTREQAEARHEHLKHYVLATRLPEGQVLILIHSSSEGTTKLQRHLRYYLWIYDAGGRRMLAEFCEQQAHPGFVEMASIDIQGAKHWHSYLDFKGGEKSIHDDSRYTRGRITDEDRSLYIFAPPRFGEFDILWQRILMHLKNEGYGAFE